MSQNNIDKAIIELLIQRFEVTEKIGYYKAYNNLPAQDQAREEAILQRLCQDGSTKGLPTNVVYKIWRLIIEETVKNHIKIKENYTTQKTTSNNLDDFRVLINQIDQELLDLFAKRYNSPSPIENINTKTLPNNIVEKIYDILI